MPAFRKKPVVIEAVQFDPDNWAATEGVEIIRLEYGGAVARIKTLEGTMLAQPGDWIIRGVKGELYPCKPDIFDATYEPKGGDR